MPKQQVEFFDNPRTYGEIHHNQIFKFVENFEKFSIIWNKAMKRLHYSKSYLIISGTET